jgi:EAL domain-containing protein (putative c-di-GMP-specific phosphodiesterase class I)
LLVNDLHQALLYDQFELFYQPQFNLIENRLVGAEALVRWTHPTRGMVSPVEFIPIVEQTGMIIRLGDWITRMACAQAKMWSQLPVPVRVAINLSAIQFKDKHLVPNLQKIVDHLGLDPSLIELEITEGIMMSNMDETIAKLKQFSDMGFVIAIDDFGTGYSSLSYLRKLPIHKLKIDQSFVRDLDSDRDSQDIIRCIISLAKSLNLEVIAEGVETEFNESFLKDLGCDEGQGYLYSQPISAGEFERQFLNQ